MGKTKAAVKRVVLAVAALAVGFAVLFGVLKLGKDDKPAYRLFFFGTIPLHNPTEDEGEGWKGLYVWYGGIRWRLLSKNEPESILLFADRIPDEYGGEWNNRVYQETEERFSWDESDIRTYLNTEFFRHAFTDVEQMAITRETAGDRMQDFLYLLTREQVKKESYGFSGEETSARAYDAPWWLLGSGFTGSNNNTMSWVKADGTIAPKADPNDGDKAIRPAFRLDLSAIVFVRDIRFPEESAVSCDLKEVPISETPPTEWIPLLSSPDQKVRVDAVAAGRARCEIRYSEASVGEGNYISAIIADQDMRVIYAYGRIADNRESGEGTVEVVLPRALKKNECLMVFSEKDDGSFKTGYASVPVTVLTPDGALTEPVISAGTLEPQQEADTETAADDIYDSYLSWTKKEFEEASREEKLRCGVATLMYEAFQENGKELSEPDIAGLKRYVKDNEEQILSMLEACFSVMDEEDETMKEIMDRTQEKLAEPAPDYTIYMGEYDKYLDYTGNDYLKADKNEKEKMTIAAMIYLVQVRGGMELDAEQLGRIEEAISQDSEQARQARDLLDSAFGFAPNETIREALGW